MYAPLMKAGLPCSFPESTSRACPLPQIKRLKPSSLYVVKIKASDGGVTLRSDKMSTISLEEERTRNVDMANFAGGCHDCLPAFV